VKHWPHVDSLMLGSFRAFSPYVFLHRSHVRWFPTDAQWTAALAAMRPQKEQRFTHQRVDAHKPMTFTYVRRPAYYATFATGDIVTTQQRFGLGLVWTPRGGTFVQSQTAGTTTAWGTRAADTSLVHEAATVPATFSVASHAVATQVGAHDLSAGELRVDYSLGSAGTKRVTFDEAGVHVAITYRGKFVEQVPLLVLPTDSLSSGPSELRVRRGNVQFVVHWSTSAKAEIIRTNERVGERAVVAVAIPGVDRLSYDIQFR
jgi:hypothetical protein